MAWMCALKHMCWGLDPLWNSAGKQGLVGSIEATRVIPSEMDWWDYKQAWQWSALSLPLPLPCPSLLLVFLLFCEDTSHWYYNLGWPKIQNCELICCCLQRTQSLIFWKSSRKRTRTTRQTQTVDKKHSTKHSTSSESKWCMRYPAGRSPYDIARCQAFITLLSTKNWWEVTRRRAYSGSGVEALI